MFTNILFLDSIPVHVKDHANDVTWESAHHQHDISHQFQSVSSLHCEKRKLVYDILGEQIKVLSSSSGKVSKSLLTSHADWDRLRHVVQLSKPVCFPKKSAEKQKTL